MVILDFFKVCGTVLAERAYEIFRELFTLINVAANLANIACFALGLGLRLNIFLIIGVGHRFFIRNHTRLGDLTNEHSVSVHIYVIFYFQ